MAVARNEILTALLMWCHLFCDVTLSRRRHNDTSKCRSHSPDDTRSHHTQPESLIV